MAEDPRTAPRTDLAHLRLVAETAILDRPMLGTGDARILVEPEVVLDLLDRVEAAEPRDTSLSEARAMVAFVLDTARYPDDHPIAIARRDLLAWFDAALAGARRPDAALDPVRLGRAIREHVSHGIHEPLHCDKSCAFDIVPRYARLTVRPAAPPRDSSPPTLTGEDIGVVLAMFGAVIQGHDGTIAWDVFAQELAFRLSIRAAPPRQSDSDAAREASEPRDFSPPLSENVGAVTDADAEVHADLADYHGDAPGMYGTGMLLALGKRGFVVVPQREWAAAISAPPRQSDFDAALRALDGLPEPCRSAARSILEGTR